MHFNALASAMLILSASGAVAQTTSPPTADEGVIVVTGKRGGERALSVDFEKVARECAECKRVLARMGKLTTRYKVKKDEIARDRDMTADSIASHTGRGGTRPRVKVPDGADFLKPSMSSPGQSQSGRFTAQAEEYYRKDYAELASVRQDVSGQVAAFLAQLEPYVVGAAESERLKRGASVVLKANRWAKKEKAADVTQAVIERLNAMEITITLPSDGPTETTQGR